MAPSRRTPTSSGPALVSQGSDGRRKASGQRSTITRVRTGCFTCRKRKKKCDERKPTCGNCQKTGVVCEGFPKPENWENRVAAKRHQASTTPPPNGFSSQDIYTPSGMIPDFGVGVPLVDSPGFSDPTQPDYDFMIEPQFVGGLDYTIDHLSAANPDEMLEMSNLVGGFGGDQNFNKMITAPNTVSYQQEIERRPYQGPPRSFIPISGVDTDI